MAIHLAGLNARCSILTPDDIFFVSLNHGNKASTHESGYVEASRRGPLGLMRHNQQRHVHCCVHMSPHLLVSAYLDFTEGHKDREWAYSLPFQDSHSMEHRRSSTELNFGIRTQWQGVVLSGTDPSKLHWIWCGNKQ